MLKNKLDDQGRKYIYLRYYICNGEYVYRTTSKRIRPEDWDKKNQRMIVPDRPMWKKDEALLFNSELYAFKAKFDDRINSYDGFVTKKIIENILDGEVLSDAECARQTNFFDYASQIVETNYKAGNYGVAAKENYISYLKVFRRFVEHTLNISPYMIADIRKEHIMQFIPYRRNVLGNTSNQVIAKSIYPIKITVRYALADGIIDPKVASSVLDLSIEPKKATYTSKKQYDKNRHLTYVELVKVYNSRASLKTNKRKMFLDSFFFSVYTGLSFSDIVTLEWSHMQKDEIHKVLVRTKIEVIIPLSPSALEILDRYRPCNTRYVFGYLKDHFDISDSSEFQKVRSFRNRVVKKVLNMVACQVGIDPFSFQAARHSFAVMSLERGVNINVLSQIMGQSPMKIVSLYGQLLPTSLTDEEKEKLFFSFTSSDQEYSNL